MWVSWMALLHLRLDYSIAWSPSMRHKWNEAIYWMYAARERLRWKMATVKMYICTVHIITHPLTSANWKIQEEKKRKLRETETTKSIGLKMFHFGYGWNWNCKCLKWLFYCDTWYTLFGSSVPSNLLNSMQKHSYK